MENDNLLAIQEVAVLLGVTVHTIELWYMWKRRNPDNENAKLLPDFVQSGPRQARRWKSSDIWKFIEFKKTIKHGRNGFMGITSQYYKKG